MKAQVSLEYAFLLFFFLSFLLIVFLSMDKIHLLSKKISEFLLFRSEVQEFVSKSNELCAMNGGSFSMYLKQGLYVNGFGDKYNFSYNNYSIEKTSLCHIRNGEYKGKIRLCIDNDEIFNCG